MPMSGPRDEGARPDLLGMENDLMIDARLDPDAAESFRPIIKEERIEGKTAKESSRPIIKEEKIEGKIAKESSMPIIKEEKTEGQSGISFVMKSISFSKGGVKPSPKRANAVLACLIAYMYLIIPESRLRTHEVRDETVRLQARLQSGTHSRKHIYTHEHRHVHFTCHSMATLELGTDALM